MIMIVLNIEFELELTLLRVIIEKKYSKKKNNNNIFFF